MQPRDALLPFMVVESRQFADVSTCFSRKTEEINDSLSNGSLHKLTSANSSSEYRTNGTPQLKVRGSTVMTEFSRPASRLGLCGTSKVADQGSRHLAGSREQMTFSRPGEDRLLRFSEA
jgi:hypothetical protein